MHALQRNVFNFNVREAANFSLLETDEVLIRQQTILALAGRPAGEAADAFCSIYQHAIACHHSPSFIKRTKASCVQNVP